MRDIQQIAAYLKSYNKDLFDPAHNSCMLMSDVQQTGAMLAKAVVDAEVMQVLTDIDYPEGSDGKRVSFLKKAKKTELLEKDGKTPKAKRSPAYRTFFGTYDVPRKTSLLSKDGGACVLIELMSKSANGQKNNAAYFSGGYKTLKPALLIYVNDRFEVQFDYVLRVTPKENSTFQMVCDELTHPVQIAPSVVMGSDYVLSSFVGYPVCRADCHFAEEEEKQLNTCNIPKDICVRLQNNPRDFFYMAYTLCNQIAHVHKTLGQPHYDVKPANVLLRIINDRVEACLIDMPMPCSSEDQLHFTPAYSVIVRSDRNGDPVLRQDGAPFLEKPGFLFHDYHGLLNILVEIIDYCSLTKEGPAAVLYEDFLEELRHYHNDVLRDVMYPGGFKRPLDWWYTPQRFAEKLRKREDEYQPFYQLLGQKPYPLPLNGQSYSVFEHHHVQSGKRLQKILATDFFKALASNNSKRYRARGRHSVVRFFRWLWWVCVVRPLRWIKRVCGFGASARSKGRGVPTKNHYKIPKSITTYSEFVKRKEHYDKGLPMSSFVLSTSGVASCNPAPCGGKRSNGQGARVKCEGKAECDGALLSGMRLEKDDHIADRSPS